MLFEDRIEAGKKLANLIPKLDNPLILAIPRGGVEIGKIMSRALGIPMDICIARKLGAPGNPELAIGAVTSQGLVFIDQEMINGLGVDKNYLLDVIIREREEAVRREKTFRSRPLSISGKDLIIVDDGIATGATIKAIIEQVKNQAKSITLAVPVIPKEIIPDLKSRVNNIIYISAPDKFYAVGQYYRDFPQLTDEDIIRLLGES